MPNRQIRYEESAIALLSMPPPGGGTQASASCAWNSVFSSPTSDTKIGFAFEYVLCAAGTGGAGILPTNIGCHASNLSVICNKGGDNGHMSAIMNCIRAFVSMLWYAVKICTYFLRYKSPAEFKMEVFEKPWERIQAKAPYASPMEDDRAYSPRNEYYSRLGTRYCYAARLSWGLDSPVWRYRNAWLNVLAAECFSKCSNEIQASNCFHYAAHALRNVAEYWESYKMYKKAAEASKMHAKGHMFAVRSYRRAISVCMMIGEYEEVRKCNRLIKELLKSENNQKK